MGPRPLLLGGLEVGTGRPLGGRRFAVDLNRNVRSPTQVRRSTGKSLANGAHSRKLDGSGASTLDAGWSMASTRASSGL
jgi:hypothetical protein